MTLLVEKGFREEDFANLHPGGKLGKRLMRVEALMHARQALPDRARRHADARRDLRDVEQGARHDLRRRRATTRCSASSPTATCAGTWSAAPTILELTAGDVMTRDPVTIRADDAGGRGAEHHGAAQDHLDRRRRRRRRSASPASCTCTTSGARRWSERGVDELVPMIAATRRGASSCSCSTSTAC